MLRATRSGMVSGSVDAATLDLGPGGALGDLGAAAFPPEREPYAVKSTGRKPDAIRLDGCRLTAMRSQLDALP